MTHFILKHKKTTAPDVSRMNAVFIAHGVNVLDDSLLPQSVLVELEEADLASIQQELGDWTFLPEKKYRVPDPEKKIR